ncbi:hypothetical protein ACF0H5_015319 [Mactra antiquata]
MENDSAYKVSASSDDKMFTKRDYFCAQLIGVFWLLLGLVGGILIGIYAYHGGPDGEVICKNLPDSWIQDDKDVTTTTEAASYQFSLSVVNTIQPPTFEISTQLTIMPETPPTFLIDYMQQACRDEPTKFTGFTVEYYPSVPGFSVSAINGVASNWDLNQTYWSIANHGTPLNLGVSAYVPSPNDDILFSLVVYSNDTQHD